MAEPVVLIVGSMRQAEFRAARQSLGRRASVIERADAGAALAALTNGEVLPEIVVIVQSYPGELTEESVDALRRAAPLARFVGLLGSWCEGERRSGRPWPGVPRVYWHQWPAHCDRQLRRLGRGEACGWSLPPTSSEEEHVLVEAEQAPRWQGMIAIYTNSFEMQDWLSALCRSCGCSTVWLRPPRSARVEGALAALFDAAECRGEELEELHHLCDALRPAPVVALFDFPRIEDVHRATAAGAAAVMSKPAAVGDLYWQFEQLLGPAELAPDTL